MQYAEWVSSLAKQASSSVTKLFITKTSAREDLSLAPLEDLFSQGYNQVTWNSARSKHSKCRELNRRKWPLQKFISNLQHSAPIFEKSHPNDKSCSVVVSGPGLPSVRVDSFGNVFEIG